MAQSCAEDIEAQRPQDAHDSTDDESQCKFTTTPRATNGATLKAIGLIASPCDILIYVLFTICLAYHIAITQIWNTASGTWTDSSIAKAYFNNVTGQNVNGVLITFCFAALFSAMFRQFRLSWCGRGILELLAFLLFFHLSNAYNASYVLRYPRQNGTCASRTMY
ncbi:hypothetical protein EV356DRAFT_533385 [Viridothelium virens]|uniref:Uncharacterized protein n=1 Tax=Viridothelium virens TaxID=1048519 RepID=A0A6A6H7C0_VIRVR|nr:hypothetical protein EV356DRAFT_533385 [Viridothelium virens]